eukprot:g16010.t1
MALGGSIPEICINVIVSLKDAYGHHPREPSDAGAPSQVSLGIGAILGSGLIAFCVIPPCCVLSTTTTSSTGHQGALQCLQLNRRPFLRDVVAYLCSLAILYFLVADTSESGKYVTTGRGYDWTSW